MTFICILKESSAATLQPSYSDSYVCYQLYLRFLHSVPADVSALSAYDDQ